MTRLDDPGYHDARHAACEPRPLSVRPSPNYLVVGEEMALLPMVFGQLMNALVCSVLNGAVLAWRSRIEEVALRPEACRSTQSTLRNEIAEYEAVHRGWMPDRTYSLGSPMLCQLAVGQFEIS